MKLTEMPVKFISDVKWEMSKVSWPNYEELRASTVIVIVLSLIFVVYIFASDWVLTKLLRMVFG